MPKYRVEESTASYVATLLHKHPELQHLRTRRRADLVTIESGPTEDPIPHARLRQDTVHLWILEMPTHQGRWEKTPLRMTLESLIEALVGEFPWSLTPIV